MGAETLPFFVANTVLCFQVCLKNIINSNSCCSLSVFSLSFFYFKNSVIHIKLSIFATKL